MWTWKVLAKIFKSYLNYNSTLFYPLHVGISMQILYISCATDREKLCNNQELIKLGLISSHVYDSAVILKEKFRCNFPQGWKNYNYFPIFPMCTFTLLFMFLMSCLRFYSVWGFLADFLISQPVLKLPVMHSLTLLNVQVNSSKIWTHMKYLCGSVWILVLCGRVFYSYNLVSVPLV